MKEFFKDLGKDEIIAVGAVKGCNYLYIGIADYEVVEKRYNEYQRKVERNLSENTVKLRNLCLSVPELTGDEEADEEVIKRYSTKIVNLSNSIREAKRYLASWIPLEERKVVESFHRDDSDDLAVLVEGTETGSFWFRSEYDKKYNK